MKRQLFLDVGNTTIDLLLVEGGKKCRGKFLPSDEKGLDSFLQECGEVGMAFLSSVCQKTSSLVLSLLTERKIPFLLLTQEVMAKACERLGYAIANIDILGQDLFCDLLYQDGPTILADFGTATKILALNSENVFLGGVILPGVPAFPKALSAQTEGIPPLPLLENPPLLSLKTEEAVSSGAINGSAFLVEGYLNAFKKMPGLEKAAVLFTGGNYPLLRERLARYGRCDANIPLLGLKRAFGA